MRLLRIVSVAALVLTACSSDNQGVETRRAALRELAETVFVPSFASFQTKANALATATSTGCGSAARDAWKAAHSEWKHIEAFRGGPIGRRRIDSAVDFWPIRELPVQEQLDATEPFTDESVMRLGADEKGLPVIEYLLFAATPQGRRCEYAGALARDLVRQADAVVNAWSPAGEDYLGDFVNAGEDSLFYPTLQRALDEVVNEQINLLATIESMKLARPLGLRTGGVPQPGAVESPYAGLALADIADNLDSVARIYDVALAPLVAPESAAIDRAIRDALAKAQTSLAAIPAPLSNAVVDDAAKVEALFADVKELVRLISADLAALLGVTVTFTDQDGD